MKAYGVKRKDFGCCPGHDKFPKQSYKNRRSVKARARSVKLSHGIARAWAKRNILKEFMEWCEF